MEWILDPSIWAALSTLIVLEVVLGIDNVVFITILSEKLPPEKRDRARILGLSLALVMRIILPCLAGWLMTLKTTLFTAYGINFNAKDIIMLAGGLFLIFKATMELNERLEGKDVEETKQKKTSNFWVVIAQIVVLDAVFSLDSVITAAGMAKDNVPIMVIAVSIAMIMMMFASKPLANFVNNHPTIVILCLSFLLMIGFSLIAEGFGVNIPKGYLYAAIGFSILIEFFNQMASFNRRKFLRKKPLRQRTAEAILGLLKGEVEAEEESVNVQDQVAESSKNETFKTQELVMVERVLSLAQRSVSSVMTSRQDVKMININDPREEILKELSENQHTRILITDDVSLDEPIGIIQVNDLMKVLLEEQEIRDYVSLIKQPLIFPETISLLVALEQFKNGKTHFAIVVDEFGSMQGIITVTDVMETIAGEFPTEDEDVDVRHDIQKISDNSWLVNGYMPIDELLHYIDLPLEDKRDYHTLAGLLMEQMQHIPVIGEHLLLDHFKFEVIEVDSHRIVKVMVTDLNENLN